MSREQQKAAAQRILEKEPLTEQERVTYEILRKNPEDYRLPGESGSRVCPVCGAEFETIAGSKERPEVPALEQFSGHMGAHNPSPAEWAEAHKRIGAGKEREKESTRGQSIA